MEEQVGLYLLDDSNNIIEEANLRKPEKFSKLLNFIPKKFKNLKAHFNIFYLSENNEEMIINNNEEYQLSKNILFIREIKNDYIILSKSIFEINYDKLSESKQDILDEKYNCYICSEQIKKEKPFLCYKCQKIFHKKCLEMWSKKRKSQNQVLACPNCRNELPLEEWKFKLDFEEFRENEAEKMDIINQYKLNNNLLGNINKIKDKKIEELNKEKKEIIGIFNKDINKISDKINEINILLNIDQLNVKNSSFDRVSKEIIPNLEIITNYIKDKIKEGKNKKEEDKYIENNLKIEENFQYKNEINLIYYTEKEGEENILGYSFVKNNRNNIDLIINGNKINLVSSYNLKKGENKITLIIKNKLTDLSYMFFDCTALKNMEELRYLNTENVTNFSYIFSKDSKNKRPLSEQPRFHSFTNINCLSTWNVSNGTDFTSLFRSCKKLSNIEALKNWDVSNGISFRDIFCGCNLLSDITPLKNWNVSKGKNFSAMFIWCFSLEDITPLKNWDVSNSETFEDMFYDCHKLTNIKALENWNVSKCRNFKEMFRRCDNLSNIEPLKNWKVLNNADFAGMFYKCNNLSNLNSLKRWNISETTKKNMVFKKGDN